MNENIEEAERHLSNIKKCMKSVRAHLLTGDGDVAPALKNMADCYLWLREAEEALDAADREEAHDA